VEKWTNLERKKKNTIEVNIGSPQRYSNNFFPKKKKKERKNILKSPINIVIIIIVYSYQV
jgi:hypothetical protein